jgi:hypothetical protein
LESERLLDNIKDVRDDILKEIIGCAHKGECACRCTTAFKITKQELDFYRFHNLPIPRLCHNCRHVRRVKNQSSMRLWHRKCMNEGCNNEFETSYAPERSEIVYCEQCYQQEVI